MSKSNTALVARMEEVINAAKRLSTCASEFDGNLAACGEHLDRLWCAVDCLEQEEREGPVLDSESLGSQVESLNLAQAHFLLKFIAITSLLGEPRMMSAIELTKSLRWLK
jgi:hypothetical protein